MSIGACGVFATARRRASVEFHVNDGDGFADYVEVEPGTTVNRLFAQKIGPGKPSHFLIRVNRQPCAPDQVLQEGDRVSITPTKIEGAVH